MKTKVFFGAEWGATFTTRLVYELLNLKNVDFKKMLTEISANFLVLQ